MVAGHLSKKNGYYYAVLNYTDELGKRKTKWFRTGLPEKGNKKKAEAFLAEIRREFQPPKTMIPNEDILFADFMEEWLEVIRMSVAIPTYASYCNMVRKAIVPYFREKGITLKELTTSDIEKYYIHESKRVSAATVIHYHANIHKALKYAVKHKLIASNPADQVERPKKTRYIGSYYDAEEVSQLLEVSKGSKLELPIMLAAFYGLRRSEVIGLKWNAVD